MTDRVAQLAGTAETLDQDLSRFLDGLAPADLQAPCADHGGETVADVLAHVQTGLPMFLAWLGSVRSGGGSGAPESASARMHRHAHPHGHGHGHGPDHAHGHGHGHGHGLLGKVSALFRGSANAHHHLPPEAGPPAAGDPSEARAWFAAQLKQGRAQIEALSPAELHHRATRDRGAGRRPGRPRPGRGHGAGPPA